MLQPRTVKQNSNLTSPQRPIQDRKPNLKSYTYPQTQPKMDFNVCQDLD